MLGRFVQTRNLGSVEVFKERNLVDVRATRRHRTVMYCRRSCSPRPCRSPQYLPFLTNDIGRGWYLETVSRFLEGVVWVCIKKERTKAIEATKYSMSYGNGRARD